MKYRDSDGSLKELYIQGQVVGDTLPVGVIVPFSGSTVPENWLLCNGQAVDRLQYNQLFLIIGTTYGAGNGSTTFNLPDLRGKTLVGLDGTDSDFNTLGKTGGEKTHTLTINEMPSHHHQRKQSGRALYWDTGLTTMGGLTSGENAEISWEIDTTDVGGGQAHNNLQPYMTQNYIIKAVKKSVSAVTATVVDDVLSTSSTDALSANQGRLLSNRIKVIEDEGVSGTVKSPDESVKNLVAMTSSDYESQSSSLESGTVAVLTDMGCVTTQSTGLTCELPLDL